MSWWVSFIFKTHRNSTKNVPLLHFSFSHWKTSRRNHEYGIRQSGTPAHPLVYRELRVRPWTRTPSIVRIPGRETEQNSLTIKFKHSWVSASYEEEETKWPVWQLSCDCVACVLHCCFHYHDRTLLRKRISEWKGNGKRERWRNISRTGTNSLFILFSFQPVGCNQWGPSRPILSLFTALSQN